MARYKLAISFLIFFASNHLAYCLDATDDVLGDIEQACQLGENEIAVIDAMMKDGNVVETNDLLRQKTTVSRILEKLGECKMKILLNDGYSTCREPDEHDAAACLLLDDDTSEARSHCIQYIKTGCDWLIRVAGVIWSLQILYGLVV